MPRARDRRKLISGQGERKIPMHAWIDGWDWVWMTFMMGFWVVLLGAVVYVAVRLAQRPPTKPNAGS